MVALINLWFLVNAFIAAVYVSIILYTVFTDSSVKFGMAFWIWNNLACGAMPFYDSPDLNAYRAPIAPNPADWRGLKLRIWNRAVAYLLRVGYLTTTTTLKEKF